MTLEIIAILLILSIAVSVLNTYYILKAFVLVGEVLNDIIQKLEKTKI